MMNDTQECTLKFCTDTPIEGETVLCKTRQGSLFLGKLHYISYNSTLTSAQRYWTDCLEGGMYSDPEVVSWAFVPPDYSIYDYMTICNESFVKE